jgi:quercetin dioxygenase-like cupin family protein
MSVSKESPVIHEKLSPDHERRIAYLENLMVVVCDFTNGPMKSPEPPHSHPHEQITYVAEGELLFFKGEQKFNLKKGDILTVQPDVPHCIQTLSSHVQLVDSFTPLRKDFLHNG